MEMPQIKNCEIGKCAYNLNNKCHAIAITIGHDAAHPMCDTFCISRIKGGDTSITATVGACKVSDCQYNKSLECIADEICVGYHNGEIDCLTFKKRIKESEFIKYIMSSS